MLESYSGFGPRNHLPLPRRNLTHPGERLLRARQEHLPVCRIKEVTGLYFGIGYPVITCIHGPAGKTVAKGLSPAIALHPDSFDCMHEARGGGLRSRSRLGQDQDQDQDQEEDEEH